MTIAGGEITSKYLSFPRSLIHNCATRKKCIKRHIQSKRSNFVTAIAVEIINLYDGFPVFCHFDKVFISSSDENKEEVAVHRRALSVEPTHNTCAVPYLSVGPDIAKFGWGGHGSLNSRAKHLIDMDPSSRSNNAHCANIQTSPIPVHDTNYSAPGHPARCGKFFTFVNFYRRKTVSKDKRCLQTLLVKLVIDKIGANSGRAKADPSRCGGQPTLYGAIFRAAQVWLPSVGEMWPEPHQKYHCCQRQKRQNRHIELTVIFHRIAPVRQNLPSRQPVCNGRAA